MLLENRNETTICFRKDKDVLFTDVNRNHILILRKGHFFVFPVLDSYGKWTRLLLLPEIGMFHLAKDFSSV